jgi:ParB-like chromosome segregation protein Spo0J
MKPDNKIEKVKIDLLIPYANNSRTHNEAQISQIAASIREFGFNNPVLIADDHTIIAGHGRVLAARKLGLEDVPCVKLTHLTASQRKAYIIADNRIALNAGWDKDILKLEIKDLEENDFDISLLGFDESEFNSSEIDFSDLNGSSVDKEINGINGGIKKTIKVPFDDEHFDEAQELISFYLKENAPIGYMILNFLRGEKVKLD